MRDVSYSEISTFYRCPWKWGMAYQQRLEPVSDREELSLGLAIHQILSASYRAGALLGVDSVTADRPLSEEMRREAERLLQAYVPTFEEDLERYEVLAAEFGFRTSLRSPLGTRSNYRLLGRVDLLLVERSTGIVWLMDHKTTKQALYGPFIDAQLATYASALQQMGLVAGGVVQNVLKRTKVAVCERSPFWKDPDEIASWNKTLYWQCAGLPKPSRTLDQLPKSFRSDCGWDCDFKDVCRLHTEGRIEAARAMLATDFRPRAGGSREPGQFVSRIPASWAARIERYRNQEEAPCVS